LDSNTRPVAWRPSKGSHLHLVVKTTARRALPDAVELAQVTIDVSGTAITAQPPVYWDLGQADDVIFDATRPQRFVMTRHTTDIATAEWKGYRGGRTGQLWLTHDGGNTFKRVTSPSLGNVGQPLLLLSNQLYLIAESNDSMSVANLFQLDLKTGQSTQLTRHADFHVRNGHSGIKT
jgi:tricorn protease-like protein